MYKKILVALENGRADESLLPHVAQLARLLGSELLLIHVADGWAARNYEQLGLAESDEMIGDRQLPSNRRRLSAPTDCASTSTWRSATRRTRSSRPPSTSTAT